MDGINDIEVEPEPDLAFKITELIHNNPLMHFFRNPYKLLKAAGLKPGLKVLEAGCGTGFFTIPASEIVDRDGFIYAVDIHPLAIKRVEEKIKQHGISNVEPVLANAYKTGLQNESIDIALIFGMHHIAGGLEGIILEMYRVLKPEGLLSFEDTEGSELIGMVEKEGFVYIGKKNRIMVFIKRKA